MEISKLHISDEYEVYLMPLLPAEKHRESELQSEKILLSQLFGESAKLCHNAQGQPYIKGSSKHISISHSKHYLTIAVSQKQPIGIDIEEIDPRLERVKEKMLTPEELQLIPNDLQHLAVVWTAKEAIYKIANQTAGAIGEHIKLNCEQIAQNKRSFSATINEQEYQLYIVSQTENFVVVVSNEKH